MTSYFEEFRKTATPAEPEKQTDADVETLVNNQEIKDDVTEMGEVIVNKVDISETVSRSVQDIVELKETIEVNPSIESNNPLVTSLVRNINSNVKELGVSIEGYETRRELVAALENAEVALEAADVSPLSALKNVIRDSWASFKGYDYFKPIYSSEFFNRFKNDVVKDTSILFAIIDDEGKKYVDRELQSVSLEASDLARVFEKGKLINGADYVKKSINAANRMIDSIAKAQSSSADTLAKMVKELGVVGAVDTLPNQKIVYKENKLGVEVSAGKAGKLTFSELETWFNGAAPILNTYANDIRKLEGKLHKAISALDKSENAVAKEYAQIVAQLCLGIFNGVIKHFDVTFKLFINAAVAGLNKHESEKGVSTESDENTPAEQAKKIKKKYSTLIVFLAFLICWPVGLYMLIHNVNAN